MLVHEAETFLDLRGSKARLLECVRRARALRNRGPRVQAFLRPQFDTEIGFNGDLLVTPPSQPFAELAAGRSLLDGLEDRPRGSLG